MTTNSVSDASSAQTIYDSFNVKKNSATSTMSDTQNRFLTLLTAQLKNQDPLNPVDNAQVTSQMAQISTVDGIERLNATLSALLNADASSQTLQAATLVGRNVLVPGLSMALTKGVGVAGLELASAADNVIVTIKDANGLVMRTLSLGSVNAGVSGFAWDGKTDSGAVAADGTYTVSAVAKQGQNDVTATVLSLGTVAGVSRSGQTYTLDITGMGKVSMNDVKEIL